MHNDHASICKPNFSLFCLVMNVEHLPKEDDLVNAIIQGKSDHALYLTCQFIHNGLHTEIENVFIEVSSRVGMYSLMPYVATWNIINTQLQELIDSDEFDITNVLKMTTMLSLLHQRLYILADGKEVRQTQAKLRKEVLDYFPENARLTSRGADLFSHIIPETPDLNAFVHRILSGFLHLFEKKKAHELYTCLTYLSKRQINIPLPNTWPAPDEQNAKTGDPIWLLWGMILLYFNNQNVATNWKLFCCNWRKKFKSKRTGLLIGIAHTFSEQRNDLVWSKHDEHVLENVHKLASELWLEFVRHAKADDYEETFSSSESNIMDYFEPRGEARPCPDTHAFLISTPAKKFIDISGKSTKIDLRQKTTKIKKLD